MTLGSFCSPQKELFPLIFSLLLVQSAFGQITVQDNLVSAFQQSINDSHSVQWTIGEVFTGTFSEGGVTVHSGLNDNAIEFIITGVNEQNEFAQVRFYPNPAAHTLMVESEKFFMDEAFFDFTDASGKKFQVPVSDVQKHLVRFQVTDLPEGFYVLVIRSKKNNLSIHIKLIRK